VKRIAVIGELNLDLIVTSPTGLPEAGKEKLLSNMHLVLGSSSAISASQFARLGNEVFFSSVVGDDNFGRRALTALQALGVITDTVVVDPSQRTGLTISIVAEGDRAQITYAGCILEMCYDRIDWDAIRTCDHLHIGSFFIQDKLRPDCPRIFKQAKEMGLTTSLDTGWDVSDEWDGGLQETLDYTDVFLPNEMESPRVAGCDTPEEALEILSKRVSVIVVKLGKRGAMASAKGETVFRPGFVVNAIDTTGAGDSFDSGFLHSWLHGASLADCLDLGNATGALSTRAAGGTGSQATLAKAEAWIKTAQRRDNRD
jgi:sugar/nucleoside kinase (ribokinase family)